jgi:3-phenylpropionate/trans-cinnamate dioxygenase ferredoxin reductase subunit
MEVGLRTETAFPYIAGQYAQIRFQGYPSRPYSLTHPLRGAQDPRTVYLHVRRMEGGRVSASLGKTINLNHRVTLTGPHGSAYFRPDQDNRLILVSTGTGFAPIWSIAVAALHENPERRIMVVAGGRTLDTLYMGPVLGRLARFPNVRVVPVCSTPQTVTQAVKLGRPTDFLPRLHESDVIYACGIPAMVESVKAVAERAGAACYADPFLPTVDDPSEESVLARALSWLPLPTAGARQRIAIASRRKRMLALEKPKRPREMAGSAYGVALG